MFSFITSHFTRDNSLWWLGCARVFPNTKRLPATAVCIWLSENAHCWSWGCLWRSCGSTGAVCINLPWGTSESTKTIFHLHWKYNQFLLSPVNMDCWGCELQEGRNGSRLPWSSLVHPEPPFSLAKQNVLLFLIVVFLFLKYKMIPEHQNHVVTTIETIPPETITTSPTLYQRIRKVFNR